MNLLKDIIVDVIKLDRVFLIDTADSVRGQTIIENIVKMSKTLGIQTIAEGVETKEQVEFLRKIGCEQAQGYYYSKPMTISEVEKLI